MVDRRAGIEVRGAKELRRTMRRAGLQLDDLKDAHKQAADVAAGGGRAAVPIGPGAHGGTLRDTIRSSGTKTAGILRAGRARVPYANAIHWGWAAHNISPQPFLSHGAQNTETDWTPIYDKAIQDALDTVKGI